MRMVLKQLLDKKTVIALLLNHCVDKEIVRLQVMQVFRVVRKDLGVLYVTSLDILRETVFIKRELER